MRLSAILLLLTVSFLCVSCGSAPQTPPKGTAQAGMDPNSPEYLAFKADIPLYPDAHLPEHASNIRNDGEEIRYEIVMTTSDSPEKVSSFYQDKLKLESSKEGSNFKLWGFTPQHNAAIIEVSKDGVETKINAVSIAGGT